MNSRNSGRLKAGRRFMSRPTTCRIRSPRPESSSRLINDMTEVKAVTAELTRWKHMGLGALGVTGMGAAAALHSSRLTGMTYGGCCAGADARKQSNLCNSCTSSPAPANRSRLFLIFSKERLKLSAVVSLRERCQGQALLL
ncbi:DUF1515 family protein [Mesorhizobium sp. 8]|uniref:DUF1515 family protein n=1 Tax=Mesorhizobium sp. 8 TaxID=2584466 RepID=UPI0032B29E99